MTAAPLCPECRDATRKHDDVGCRVPGCFCGQTRATLAAALDELPAAVVSAAPAFVEPVVAPGCAYCRAFTVGSPQTEHLVCECEQWCGAERCTHHPDTLAAMARFEAERAAPLDSPAGEDGEVSGVAPQPAQGDLPGTSPAPAAIGHEAAAAPPVSGQPAEEDGPPASAAGQLLGSWITWHCPLHLVFVELPYGHADCPTGLIRARVTVRREDADA